MFAINHAAAALIFKKHAEDRVSFILILIAVQFVELLWVGLNLIGIEKVQTEATVHFVGDIHLSYMPYSHSILTSVILSLAAGIFYFFWKKSWKAALLVGLAFASHIVLDLLTHAKDLPLGFSNAQFAGLGLYDAHPMIGFLLEFAFGLFCWWYYRGNKELFWVITVFNLANITMFLPQVKGLEYYMAGKPVLITLVIFAQIIITLVLVGWLASKKRKV